MNVVEEEVQHDDVLANKKKKKEYTAEEEEGTYWRELVEEYTVNKGDDHHCFLNKKTTVLINRQGKKFTGERLKDKFVLLYFLTLPHVDESETEHYFPDPEYDSSLEEIYNLHSVDNFEIVFVAIGDNLAFFDLVFSQMPWLAVPHQRQQDRRNFKAKFAVPDWSSIRGVLFAPDGVVISENMELIIGEFGANAFPFNDEKLNEFYSECHVLRNQIFMDQNIPSYTKLLGNHVVSFTADGEKKVPTSHLDTKTLALFFFSLTTDSIELKDLLLDVWNSFSDSQRNDFKIVVVNKDPFYLYTVRAQLKQEFGSEIPWYVIGVCGKKLGQIFETRCDFRRRAELARDLVVLKRDDQHLSSFASSILANYGCRVYPSTLQVAVKSEKE